MKSTLGPPGLHATLSPPTQPGCPLHEVPWNLQPLPQLQPPHQGIFCGDSARIPLIAPTSASAILQSTLCVESPGTPWTVLISVSATLTGCPLCREPRGHPGQGLLQLWPSYQENPAWSVLGPTAQAIHSSSQPKSRGTHCLHRG